MIAVYAGLSNTIQYLYQQNQPRINLFPCAQHMKWNGLEWRSCIEQRSTADLLRDCYSNTVIHSTAVPFHRRNNQGNWKVPNLTAYPDILKITSTSSL